MLKMFTGIRIVEVDAIRCQDSRNCLLGREQLPFLAFTFTQTKPCPLQFHRHTTLMFNLNPQRENASQWKISFEQLLAFLVAKQRRNFYCDTAATCALNISGKWTQFYDGLNFKERAPAAVYRPRQACT